MPILTVLPSLLLASTLPWCAVSSAAAQSPAAPAQDVVGPPPVAPPDAEGEALTNEFGAKAKAWHEHKLALSRGGMTPDPKVLGPYPALEFKPRFEALLEKGSGWAQVWWIDNLDHLYAEDDEAGRRKAFVENFDRLIATNASQSYMMYVLGNLRAQRELLGAEAVNEMLRRVVAASKNAEIQARAAQMHAVYHQPSDPAADPARHEEALELHRTVLATWPETLGARDSAAALLPGIQAEFERALRAWLATIVALEKQGASIEDWPAAPLENFHPLFVPLSRSGLPSGIRWINRIYNQHKAGEAQGRVHTLAHLAVLLGPAYPVATAQVQDVRMGLLELLTRAFPGHPSVVALLEDLRANPAGISPATAERALAHCLTGADAYAKAIAHNVLVQCWLQQGSWTAAVEALQWCDRMARECPGHPLLQLTQKLCAQVRKLLPGSPAPDFEIGDLENKRFKLSDYKGRVVLLVVYNQFLDQGFGDVPLWRDFQSQNFKRPFSVIGINAGAANVESFYSKAAQLGISWRTGMLFQGSGPIMSEYRVVTYPAVVVIDADGVIRGRDLPWPATKTLLEEWIGKAEQAKR